MRVVTEKWLDVLSINALDGLIVLETAYNLLFLQPTHPALLKKRIVSFKVLVPAPIVYRYRLCRT